MTEVSIFVAIQYYIDVSANGAITRGLQQRGIDVLTAQEDGTDRMPDAQLLDRAGELGRLIFTHDDDFLAEAKQRQTTEQNFMGVIYIHQHSVNVRRCIDDLEIIALASELEEYANKVVYLPLQHGT